MSGQVINFSEHLTPLGKRRAHLLLGRNPIDMDLLIADLDYAVDWMKKNDIRVLGYRCDNYYGSTATVINGRRAHALLGGKSFCRGHHYTAKGRVEQWEARIPDSTVLLQWEEEASA